MKRFNAHISDIMIHRLKNLVTGSEFKSVGQIIRIALDKFLEQYGDSYRIECGADRRIEVKLWCFGFWERFTGVTHKYNYRSQKRTLLNDWFIKLEQQCLRESDEEIINIKRNLQRQIKLKMDALTNEIKMYGDYICVANSKKGKVQRVTRGKNDNRHRN